MYCATLARVSRPNSTRSQVRPQCSSAPSESSLSSALAYDSSLSLSPLMGRGALDSALAAMGNATRPA